MTLSPRAVEAAARAAYHATPRNKPYDILTLHKKNLYRAEAEAALTAALAVDGLCLAPKEPTMAMLYAGERAWINDPLKRSSTLYRSMIAAASDGDSPRKTEG